MKKPASIFVDLSKAFDNLCCGILVDKLEYYGISRIPLELIRSIPLNRQQNVSYKDCESDLLEKNWDPTGIYFRCIVFSIYINDIVSSISKLSFLMYADDTNPYFNIEDISFPSREAAINNEIKNVHVQRTPQKYQTIILK